MQPPLRGNEAIMPLQHYAARRPRCLQEGSGGCPLHVGLWEEAEVVRKQWSEVDTTRHVQPPLSLGF